MGDGVALHAERLVPVIPYIQRLAVVVIQSDHATAQVLEHDVPQVIVLRKKPEQDRLPLREIDLAHRIVSADLCIYNRVEGLIREKDRSNRALGREPAYS